MHGLPSNQDAKGTQDQDSEGTYLDAANDTQRVGGLRGVDSSPEAQRDRPLNSSSPLMASPLKNGMQLPSLNDFASSSPVSWKPDLNTADKRAVVNKLMQNPSTSLAMDAAGKVRALSGSIAPADASGKASQRGHDEQTTQLIQASPNAIAQLAWGNINETQDSFAQVMGTPRQEVRRRRDESLSASGELDVIRSDDEEDDKDGTKTRQLNKLRNTRRPGEETVQNQRASLQRKDSSRIVPGAKDGNGTADDREEPPVISTPPDATQEVHVDGHSTQRVISGEFVFTQPAAPATGATQAVEDATQPVNIGTQLVIEATQNADATQPVHGPSQRTDGHEAVQNEFDATQAVAQISSPQAEGMLPWRSRKTHTLTPENRIELDDEARDGQQNTSNIGDTQQVSGEPEQQRGWDIRSAETPARPSRTTRPVSSALRQTPLPPIIMETPAHQIGRRSKRGRVVPSTSPSYTPLQGDSAVRSTRKRRATGDDSSESPAGRPAQSLRRTGVANRGRLATIQSVSIADAGEMLDSDQIVDETKDMGGSVSRQMDEAVRRSGNGAWLAWNDRKWYAAELVGGDFNSVLGGTNKTTKVFTYTKSDTREETEADVLSLRPLDLQVGDLVRVEGKGNKEFDVIELTSMGSDEISITLEDGIDTATLRSRPPKTKKSVEPETITVPLHRLYLTPKMVQLYLEKRGQETNIFTQAADIFAVRKAKQAAIHAEQASRLSSVAMSPTKSRIFNGCLFTLSGFEADAPIFADIALHGGIVLDSLQDLFKVTNAKGHLSLEWDGDRNFQFAGVIAKSGPLRTAKYLEALALGWPCLSSKFIEHCLERKRFLDNWSDYVLSSGKSEVLDGYLNYDVQGFRELWERNASLEEHFRCRKRLLGNDSVYVVRHGDIKKNPVGFALLAISSNVVESASSASAPPGALIVDSKDTRPFSKSSTKQKGKEWVIQVLINRRLV